MNMDRFSEYRDVPIRHDDEREAIRADQRFQEMREREFQNALEQQKVTDHMLEQILGKR